jgi:sterol desaturase/sphingolipid hydroxylase (fatty acid hydroxylase superfamily)
MRGIENVIQHFASKAASSFHLQLLILSFVLTIFGIATTFVAQSRLQGEKLSLRRFLAFTFPAALIRGHDLWADVQFSITRMIVGPLLLFQLTALAIAVATALKAFGSHYLHIVPSTHIGTGALVMIYLAGFMAYDFCNYFGHYLEHRVPLLWELHKVHHSAEILNPLTARRFHPFQEQFDNLVLGIGTGITFGLFGIFYQMDSYDFGFMSVDLWYVSEIFTFHYLRHSHVPMRFGWLEWVLMSPAHHQLHHSREVRHWDRNFCTTLSIWDRAFGTYYDPVPGEAFALGLPKDEHRQFRNVLDFYWRPIKRIAAMGAPEPVMVARTAQPEASASLQDERLSTDGLNLAPSAI